MTEKMMDDIVVEQATQTVTKLDRPKRYAVYFHNDDFTPQEFVIHVLQEYYNKSFRDASTIMITVHNSDKAIVDLYTKEVAVQKVKETSDHARSEGFPLLVTCEEYDD